MRWARLSAFLMAILVHATLLYTMFVHPFLAPAALSQGNGPDEFTVTATVSIQNSDVFTQSPRTAAQDQDEDEGDGVARREAKPEPQKLDTDTRETIGQPVHEAKRAPTHEDPIPPKTGDAIATASLAATPKDEQTAALQTAGHRKKLWSAYELSLHNALESAKKRPNRAASGNVLLSVTIDAGGKLVQRAVYKSSGSAELDRAALASVDRAAPFPPMPSELGLKPITVVVPFEYRTR